MFKKKSLFVVFEGIEGSGKSYQSKKLLKNLKKNNYLAIYTREPGGSKSAEIIRKTILTGEKKKFTKTTDTLLYLAARNEHIEKTLKRARKKNINIICDRFVDSTIAYQVYGFGVNRHIIDTVHKNILKNITPDLTFVLKVSLKKAFERIKKRKKLNRYDKFTKKFYTSVQNTFIDIAKKNPKKYLILDTSIDTRETEKIIFKKFISKLK